MGNQPKQPDYIQPPSAGESAISYGFGDAEWAQGLGVLSPEVQEAWVEAERLYGPEYVKNELARQETALWGADGQEGLVGQMQRAAPAFGGIESDLLTARRERDIGDVEGLGSRATEALRQSDPDRLALLEQQRGVVDDLFARAGGLTTQQRRMAEQGARQGAGARGRELDNVSIFGEGLLREELMRANRQEALAGAQGLFGQYQATSADPFQAILGRPSGAQQYAMASGQQALGLGAGPTIANPDTGVNLALMNNANQNQFAQSNYGAQQARSGAMWGGALSGLGSIIGGGFAGR